MGSKSGVGTLWARESGGSKGPVSRGWVVSGMCALALASAASAQSCTPAWDGAVGIPGVADGYVAPITPFDFGSGTELYIGGSFTSAGGSAANKWLARYNPTTNVWSKVGTGITQGNTNQFITAIVPFSIGGTTKLVVAGFFPGAGGVADTRSLAAWDGSAWSSLGVGWTTAAADSVWAVSPMSVGSGSEVLVAGGGFTTIGGVSGVNGVAMWDGAAWSAMGSGIAGSFSPVVFALQQYDDGSGPKLYAGGRFSSIGGVPGMVGRWNGSAWEAAGTIQASSIFGDIWDFQAFDDGSGTKLYACGSDFSLPSSFDTEVACFDGVSWQAVGQPVGGRSTSLAVFDDGTGPRLYMGGTAQPTINYICRLEGGVWVPVAGGVNVNAGSTSGSFPSIFGLAVYDGALWAGGSQKEIGGQTCNGLARYVGCDACYPDCDGSGTLNIFDYICFSNAYAAQQSYADCDGSGTLNVFDYICFGNAYAAGCP